MPSVLLSVVIVSWNSKDVLKDLLSSLLLYKDDFKLDIVVVDNNSSDESVSMLKENFPFVRAIENKNNLGFAKANNQGVKQAQAEKVLLINPDTQIRAGTLKKLVDFLDENDAAGIVGPKILDSKAKVQKECARNFPGPFTEFLQQAEFLDRLSGYYLKDEEYHSVKKVPCISGACMMLRKKIFLETGGFDERFFMYGEDMDICFQAQKRGFEVWYLPDAEIVHLGGISTGQKLRLESCKSMALFLAKNRGIFESFLYRSLLFVCLSLFVLRALFFYLLSIDRNRWR